MDLQVAVGLGTRISWARRSRKLQTLIEDVIQGLALNLPVSSLLTPVSTLQRPLPGPRQGLLDGERYLGCVLYARSGRDSNRVSASRRP